MNDSPSPHTTRTPDLTHLSSPVLFGKNSYKGARVLDALYALELGATRFDVHRRPATYGLLPLILASGTYATRKRGG